MTNIYCIKISGNDYLIKEGESIDILIGGKNKFKNSIEGEIIFPFKKKIILNIERIKQIKMLCRKKAKGSGRKKTIGFINTKLTINSSGISGISKLA